MKTTTNRTKGLQGKRLFAVSLSTLLSLEVFSTNRMADLHSAITKADPHHHFLATIITVFICMAIWQFYSVKSETTGSDKRTRSSNHKRLRLKSMKIEKIKPVTIDTMGL